MTTKLLLKGIKWKTWLNLSGCCSPSTCICRRQAQGFVVLVRDAARTLVRARGRARSAYRDVSCHKDHDAP